MVDFVGARAVAYLATTIDVEVGTSARLEFSTTDALAIWINGRFRGYGDTDPYAWYDFGMNPDHPPGDAVALELGRNEVLVRVRDGVYSSAGFFARVATVSPSG